MPPDKLLDDEAEPDTIPNTIRPQYLHAITELTTCIFEKCIFIGEVSNCIKTDRSGHRTVSTLVQACGCSPPKTLARDRSHD
ncbi:hypothetical protein T265_04044 [Opisthorchis viverrini]|uniref:Uncharacterized protein n=1 Tax=Opisthorchis viverrini TaxID=6198 RepID=A0A074ZTZ6_OPIVI|nr:hypothetical protein T265_04044 [Opisthorchis viverrini]KER29297.1 hypothetical protein T265_04044 [Opisthorchis viverrini]